MDFEVDWKKYFTTKLFNKKKVQYSYKNKIPNYTDDFDWNTKCIWYGRRKINYKIKLNDIQYDT
jgi:hypothetical protein